MLLNMLSLHSLTAHKALCHQAEPLGNNTCTSDQLAKNKCDPLGNVPLLILYVSC